VTSRSDRLGELQRALAGMGPYLLSHHRADERYRCHRLRVGGRGVAVCARCSGVYPGIAAGLALVLTGTGAALWPWLVALGPAPALVDWVATTLGARRGHNGARTATGALLGAGYGVAIPWFLADPELWLAGVALCYGALAAVGLWLAGDI